MKQSLAPFIGLALLAACSPDARMNAMLYLNDPITPSMVTVTVEDGTRRWTWTGSDFATSPESAMPVTPWMHTSTSGDARVSFELRDGDAVVSTGSIILPLQDDWQWGVDLMVRSTNPMMGCLGCTDAVAFPIADAYRTESRDSLWLVWGGNSISNPLIY
jgi:hypothetical protein